MSPTRYTPTCLLLGLCFAPSALARSDRPEAGPRFHFSGDAAALRCLTKETPNTACAPERATLRLEWLDGEVRGTAEGIQGIGFERFSLELQPSYSFKVSNDSILAPVRVTGSIESRDTGRRFRIQQNNVGEFFARSLLVLGDQSLKFLFPVMFTSETSGQDSFGILSANCDSALEHCTEPSLVFRPVLAHFHLAPLGFPEEPLPHGSPTDPTDPTESLETCNHCCLDPSIGKCKCVCKQSACNAQCHDFWPDTCNDCLKTFLCHCP